MAVRAPVRGTSLAQQTQDILTERIKNGLYPPETQIPPENELATEFNVSRATIRTAISALAERGLVVRRHGIGTFVSQRSRLANPLNEAIDFNHMIANNGFTPGVQHLNTRLISPDTKVSNALNIEPGQSVIQDYKIFTADDQPVIYCVNFMPIWMFETDLIDKIITAPAITEPLYDFLDKYCQQQVDYFIAKVWADLGRNCQIPDFTLEPLTPVLVIEEVAHNANEVPLWYSLEYYPNNNIMTFELIRQRVRS